MNKLKAVEPLHSLPSFSSCRITTRGFSYGSFPTGFERSHSIWESSSNVLASADLPMQIIEQNWRGKTPCFASQCRQWTQWTMHATRSRHRRPHSFFAIDLTDPLWWGTFPFDMSAEHSLVVRSLHAKNLGFSLFDQFGNIPATCMNSWDLLILPRQTFLRNCSKMILHSPLRLSHKHPLSITGIQNTDHCCFTILGETPAPMVVSDAFTNALDSHALLTLQRKVLNWYSWKWASMHFWACQQSWGCSWRCLSFGPGHWTFQDSSQPMHHWIRKCHQSQMEWSHPLARLSSFIYINWISYFTLGDWTFSLCSRLWISPGEQRGKMQSWPAHFQPFGFLSLWGHRSSIWCRISKAEDQVQRINKGCCSRQRLPVSF